MPSLAGLLRKNRLASPYSAADDFVFASRDGSAFGYRNVERRGLDAAAAAAGLNKPRQPKLRLHDLRHTYATLLIAHGEDVASVAAQLGHAGPDITLKVYTHLFEAKRNAVRIRSQLESSLGTMMERADGDSSAVAATATPRTSLICRG